MLVSKERLEELKAEVKGVDQDAAYAAMRGTDGWRCFLYKMMLKLEAAHTELVASDNESDKNRGRIAALTELLGEVETSALIHAQKRKEAQSGGKEEAPAKG